MKRPFVAGNWKMNLNAAEAAALAKATRESVEAAGVLDKVDVAVCPSTIYLAAASAELNGSEVGLGAQNMYHKGNGAYTGETSAEMLQDLGCKYVILGHSERRRQMGESNLDVNRKVLAALEAGLIPIVCLGETLEEREADQTADIVSEQFYGSLAGITDEDAAKIVIAYEPVWAIGTGETASPAQAEAVHVVIRKLLATRFSEEIATGTRIQYGGSVNAENANELLSQPNIDGALVGGKSLDAGSFLPIIKAASTM